MAITKVTSSVLSSGSATDGYVLTADGSGNSAWEAAAGGGVDGIVSSADATAITIDSSENVGIGTTSPSNVLDVAGNVSLANYSGTGENQTILAQNDYGQMRAGIRSGIPYIGSISALDFALYTGNTERMRIDSSGNVVVGHTSAILSASNRGNVTINGASESILSLGINGSQGGYLYHDGTTQYLVNTKNGGQRFFTNNSERMRINSTGSVLIGTSTNPTYGHKLVASGNTIPDGVVRIEDIDASVGLSNTCLGLAFPNDADATSGYFVYMTDSNNNVGSITAASGTSVSFNTTSDERLKKNIVDASSQLDTIKNIQVREFDWKRNDVHEVGVVAQELINIIPDAVHEGGEDEAKNPFGVDYGKIVPYLIKAVQEQQTIIDNLTTRIETLENA